MKNTLVLVGSIVITQLVGGLGALVTQPGIENWYQQLNKPVFTPPNWLFGPAWTLLYILMAVSAYLVWQQVSWDWSILKWYFLQLGLNFLWSFLFFGLRQPGLAFLEIVLLQAAILKTFVEFKHVSQLAGYLLVPYIGWVGFASLLNLAIVILN